MQLPLQVKNKPLILLFDLKIAATEWNSFQSLVGGTFEQPSQKIVIEPQPSSFVTVQTTEEKPKAISEILTSVAKKTKEATTSVVSNVTNKLGTKQETTTATNDFSFFDDMAPMSNNTKPLSQSAINANAFLDGKT